jgi:hypothetical protein
MLAVCLENETVKRALGNLRAADKSCGKIARPAKLTLVNVYA